MPLDDLYEVFSDMIKDVAWTQSSIVGLNPITGLGVYPENDLYVSSDSNDKWFLMGISKWGADAEGNADIVGE